MASGASRSFPTSGMQLKAKQKLKGYYANISERQFRKIYEEAARLKGDTPGRLIGLLETRIDTIVYRAKFVPTPFAARQFVSHGHVRVNGRKVNIASYRCKVGDVIEVKEKSRQLGLILEALELAERDTPDYLEVDTGKMTVRYLRGWRDRTSPIRWSWSRTRWWSSIHVNSANLLQ